MADTKNQTSPILVILCVVGLLAFLILVLYPNYRNMKDYDRRISALNGEIALRQALAPIYSKLVYRARIAPSTQLASPEKKALDVGNTARLAQIFQDIANTAELTLESLIPDAQTVDRANGRLMVEAVFRGEFLNLQPLINTIVEQSYVDRIHKIQVRCEEENKWIKLSVSLLHR
ncbi:MAG: hypothetical protein KFF68_15245 [Desulfosarcina sp.]|nr:hypothetical protein [Desulfosarcina sp.]